MELMKLVSEKMEFMYTIIISMSKLEHIIVIL